MRDPYEVLGVERNATPEQIKSAFRKLAALHHPDKNPGDPAAEGRFKEINLAHQILSDPTKRARLDQFGTGRPGGVPSGVSMDDLFGDILGAFGIQREQGGDLRVELSLTFEEAALGCERSLEYQRQDSCSTCQGNGGKPGTAVSRCGSCGGSGKLHAGFGAFGVAVPCRPCRGSGVSFAVPCATCAGTGVERRKRTLNVNVPPGIEDGATQLVPGAGERRRPESPAGDLEIVLRVGKHPLFWREADDILSKKRVPLTMAALGGATLLVTLEGNVDLRIPPGTQPGDRLRLKGKGVPHRFRSGRGDHLVEIEVTIPRDLSSRARELLTNVASELEPSSDYNPSGWFARLKHLFR